MSETNWLEEIQKKIDYHFKNEDLLQQAFVRRSFSRENGGSDNEILEFIGDRALELAVTRMMMEEYGYYMDECENYVEGEDCNEFYSEMSEGELTEIKKKLVQGKTLSKVIDELGWQEHLYLGKGDESQHIENKDSVKEDLFEAIIGAVALDSNWNIDAIQSVVEILLKPNSILGDDKEIDYLAVIQEWYSNTYKKYPKFDYIKTEFKYTYQNVGVGCNIGDYICVIKNDNKKNLNTVNRSSNMWAISGNSYGLSNPFIYIKGIGNSPKEARNDLCLKLYYHLVQNGIIKTIKSEIENPNKNEAINQLETLARRGYFSIPEYMFKEGYDKNGNPIWTVHCKIKEVSVQKYAKSSLKKEAKKQAAYSMLLYVLENMN